MPLFSIQTLYFFLAGFLRQFALADFLLHAIIAHHKLPALRAHGFRSNNWAARNLNPVHVKRGACPVH